MKKLELRTTDGLFLTFNKVRICSSIFYLSECVQKPENNYAITTYNGTLLNRETNKSHEIQTMTIFY